MISLAFEDLKIGPIKLSEHNHPNINIIDNYFAVSVVPISDEEIYSATIDQNLAELSNVDLWKG